MNGEELGLLPEVHPRVFVCQQARNELSTFLIDLETKHALSTCELLMLLNEMEARALKGALRAERHPEAPDTPAGWK